MPLDKTTQEKLDRAFRPHAPIEEQDAFQGRQDELTMTREAIGSEGAHAIIYGEHGAGKTSLANVATAGLGPVKVFCEENVTFPRLCLNILQEFAKSTNTGLVYDWATNSVRLEGSISAFKTDGLTGNELKMLLPSNRPIVIILDEVDRILDGPTVRALAEMCKNFSTQSPKVTFLMVGVARTANELLKGHVSLIRNLVQVPLERMKQPELKAIIARGESVLGLTFDDRMKSRILNVCDQLPYYLHLIAKNAAKSALEGGSKTVRWTDFNAGLKAAARGCEASLSEVYDTAVRSESQSQLYRQLLWTVAFYDDNARHLNDIVADTKQIVRDEKRRGEHMPSDETIVQAVMQLCGDTKKNILTCKDGHYYGFSNPLMRGYVRLVREVSELDAGD